MAQWLGVGSGGFLEGQGGVLFPAGRGTVDGALLGGGGSGIRGQGAVATYRFRALRDGETRLRLESVLARDAANRPLDADALSRSVTAALPARTLLLSAAPNPAVGAASLSFALARAGDAELAVLLGGRAPCAHAGAWPAGCRRAPRDVARGRRRGPCRGARRLLGEAHRKKAESLSEEIEKT